MTKTQRETKLNKKEMMAISIQLSIITLLLTAWALQQKEMEWLNGLENKSLSCL